MAKKPQDAQHNQHGKHAQRGQQQKRGGKAQATASPATRVAHTPAAPTRPWRPGRDKFLPVSRADMDARGWDQCDFVYICGDAYVDHPSFGMAIVSRVLDGNRHFSTISNVIRAYAAIVVFSPEPVRARCR